MTTHSGIDSAPAGSAAEPATKVSVVIASYRRAEELLAAIASVLSQDCDAMELLVVDQSETLDAATDSALAAIRDSRLRYFRVQPPSLPAARNFGLQHARGAIVLFVDDDVRLHPGCVRAHWQAHSADTRVAAVVGRTVIPGRAPARRLPRIALTGRDHGGFDFARDGDVPTVLGCNMSFRTEILRDLGGFDTRFAGNAHREESDVSFRLRRRGHRIRFCSSAVLDHLVAPQGGCRAGDPSRDGPHAFQNEFLFFLKNRPRVLLPCVLAGQLLFGVLHPKVLRRRRALRRLHSFGLGLAGAWRLLRRPPPPLVLERMRDLDRMSPGGIA